MKHKLNGILLAALVAVFMAGCTQEARQNYDEAGDKMGSAAQSTGDAVSKDAEVAGEAIEDAAANVAEETREAARKAEEAGDAAGMTGAVKSAILAAKDLEAKDINVDTVGKTITLKGSVPDAKMKSRAETLAKATAGGSYTVKNELTVGGG